MFRENAQHTGLSAYSGPSTATKNWSYATGDAIDSSPAIGPDGTIYIGSIDHNLYALNSNGSLKWSFPVSNDVESSPAIGPDGTIYVGCDDMNLYAVNADGSEKWAYLTGDVLFSSPAIAPDGTVYVGSFDGNLYAINPDGSLQWSFTTGEKIYSSPAIGTDGTIYVGSSDDNLYAINPDGSLQWRFAATDVMYASPAIAPNGTIYAGSIDGYLYALNTDGSLQWAFPTPVEILSSPAVGADGTIYFGACTITDEEQLQGIVYALNSDGTQKWAFFEPNPPAYPEDGIFYSSPVIGKDGTLYIGCDDGNLYALNADGTLKWSYTTGGEIISSPTIGTQDTLYFGSIDSNVYALADRTLPALAVVKSVSASAVQASSTVTYTLTYSNYGFGAASNVVLTDPLPAQVSYLPGSVTGGGSYSSNTNTVSWALGTLAAGGSGQVAFKVTVAANSTLDSAIANTALIACTEVATPVMSNTAAFLVTAQVNSYILTPQAGPNGSISPNTPQPVAAGGSYTFTATPATGYSVDTWSVDGTVQQTGGTQFTLSQVNASHTILVTFNSPLTGLTMTPNPLNGTTPGTAITLTAIPTGGLSLQFEFYAAYTDANGNNQLAIIQAYGSSATCTWTPPVPAVYTLGVCAREAGETVLYDLYYTVQGYVVEQPMGAVTMSETPASPALLGKAITLSATATGGANVQYQFWVYQPSATPDGVNCRPTPIWRPASGHRARQVRISSPAPRKMAAPGRNRILRRAGLPSPARRR